MAEVSTHPSAQALAQFGNGRLPEAEALAVAGHLESCPDCRQTVAGLPPDSFLDKVRAARPVAATPTEPTTPTGPSPVRPESVANAAGPGGAAQGIPPELTGHL